MSRYNYETDHYVGLEIPDLEPEVPVSNLSCKLCDLTVSFIRCMPNYNVVSDKKLKVFIGHLFLRYVKKSLSLRLVAEDAIQHGDLAERIWKRRKHQSQLVFA